jgi:hypothetical protein
MTVYDGIAEANGDGECRAWLRKVIDANDETVALLTVAWMGMELESSWVFLKGSFNLSLCIEFGYRRQSTIIRCAKPEHTTWRA